MKKILRDNKGTILVDLDTYLMNNHRRLFIEGEITYELADKFAREIMVLSLLSRDTPVYLYIDSPGGIINAGLYIHDIVRESGLDIRAFVSGRAYSMAAIIFASCPKRYLLANSELMIHEPLLADGRLSGSSSSVKSVSDSLQKSKDKIVGILCKCTNKSKREVEKAIEFDNYLNAQQALDFGMADAIVSFKEYISGEVKA